jgi:Arc/MetJ family transcription regulator
MKVRLFLQARYPKYFLTTYALIMHINTYIQEGYMRTTLNIEDNLIKKVSKLTGIKEKTTLVKLGLEALIAMESSKRLAKLGGTEKELKMIPRRRIAEK